MRSLSFQQSKRFFIVAIALLVAAGSAAGVIAATGGSRSASNNSTPAFPPSAKDFATLRSVARDVANGNGDPSPISGTIYASSRKAAASVSQSEVDSDQPVYVIVLHGHFRATHVPLPPGAEPPSGDYLTMTWDPVTQQVTDFGVRVARPDMSTLGSGMDLGL